MPRAARRREAGPDPPAGASTYVSLLSDLLPGSAPPEPSASPHADEPRSWRTFQQLLGEPWTSWSRGRQAASLGGVSSMIASAEVNWETALHTSLPVTGVIRASEESPQLRPPRTRRS